jgi:mevalonate kinase
VTSADDGRGPASGVPGFTGWGSGKLILVGEHAVVHGEPAIAFAVDLGTRATLTPLDADTPNEVHAGFDDAQLSAALATALGPTGWRVELTSTLPVGRGMGSSASLGVALARARFAAQGHEPTPDEVFDAAMKVEAVFHGTPSGLDVAVSARGGALLYQRTPAPTFQPLACPPWQLVVVDTGKKGSTRELVAGVAARRPAIDPHLRAVGVVARAALGCLHDARALGPLLNENHALLRQIGVSTPELDELCAAALAAGALGAKLSGAGGGGVAIALVDDPAPVLAEMARRGVPAWVTRPQPAPGPA